MDQVEALHHRYAKALFETARSGYNEDKVMFDLEFLAALIRGREDAAKFLYSPRMSREEKMKFFAAIGEKRGFSTEFGDFFKLLLRKRRLRLLHGVLLSYRDLYDMHKNRIVVLLKSAYKLEQKQIERIKAILGRPVKKEILIKHSLDPSLIGGLVLKAGDRMYDASVKTNILKLKEEIGR